jgi:hypothetical protein
VVLCPNNQCLEIQPVTDVGKSIGSAFLLFASIGRLKVTYCVWVYLGIHSGCILLYQVLVNLFLSSLEGLYAFYKMSNYC